MSVGYRQAIRGPSWLLVLVFATTPLTACASTLDEAYDEGGAGAGRTIETDAGPVELAGPGGLVVESELRTGSLVITGGADIAEPFEFSPHERPIPGYVVVIDPHNPGQLRVSDSAYDARVAGVVAGAGALSPGVTMTGRGQGHNSGYVALTGLVYVWADATDRPIRPGDLLTSSNTEGHAMRVTDHELARGAILGKAMTSLPEGKGLVLMLVSLL